VRDDCQWTKVTDFVSTACNARQGPFSVPGWVPLAKKGATNEDATCLITSRCAPTSKTFVHSPAGKSASVGAEKGMYALTTPSTSVKELRPRAFHGAIEAAKTATMFVSDQMRIVARPHTETMPALPAKT